MYPLQGLGALFFLLAHSSAAMESVNGATQGRWFHFCSKGAPDTMAAYCPHEQWWIQLCPQPFWEYRYVFWACAALYIPLWKSIQMYLHDRKPLGETCKWFKVGLFSWNVFLSILSIGCLVNIGAAVLPMRTKFSGCFQSDAVWGFQGLQGEDIFRQREGGKWLMIFMVSKIPEMLDTVWLVANKKEVIALQWWHHLSVMLYCWLQAISYPDSGDGILFALVNSFIHSIMYPYFALSVVFKSVRVQCIRMTITLLQISQMFIGVGLRLYYDRHCTPIYPEQQYWVGVAGWLIYGSYLLLFIKFFIDEYYLKKPKVALSEKKAN